MVPTLRVSIVAILLVVFFAAGSSSAKDKATITKQQAKKTALSKFPAGKILSTELEHEGGMFIWSMDVKVGKDIQEVWVDAKTGEIKKVEKEDPAHEREEHEAEKKGTKSTK